jgi:hypothetical protein
MTRRASRTGKVSFDKRGRPGSGAITPDYDFVEPYGQDRRGAMIFRIGVRMEQEFCDALVQSAISAHADRGEQKAQGINGRQAQPGDPGLVMR